jgi:hypothetical protein
LEAQELLVIERGIERSDRQALQAQITKKDGNDTKSKKKGKGKFNNGNWSNNGKTMIDDKVESSNK